MSQCGGNRIFIVEMSAVPLVSGRDYSGGVIENNFSAKTVGIIFMAFPFVSGS